MRNISFSITQEQIRARSKTVTRRLGWKNLKPGDLLQACEKCQGLKRGESPKRICVIRVTSIRVEPLKKLSEPNYGVSEIAKEGFADGAMCWPSEFIRWFCESHKQCTPETDVTRIEFEYV